MKEEPEGLVAAAAIAAPVTEEVNDAWENCVAEELTGVKGVRTRRAAVTGINWDPTPAVRNNQRRKI